METWRITAKTEIWSESISTKANGNLAYDVQGVILCHFMPHDETVNAQYYAVYIQNHLRRAVRRKRPQLQKSSFCMIMQLHITRFVSRICYDAGGGKYALEHPPYSPDLSPWDYDLIPKLKASLRGHKFRTRDGIAIAVRRLIITNFSHGEADGIRRLPHLWQRTINSLGDYFEGL